MDSLFGEKKRFEQEGMLSVKSMQTVSLIMAVAASSQSNLIVSVLLCFHTFLDTFICKLNLVFEPLTKSWNILSQYKLTNVMVS